MDWSEKEVTLIQILLLITGVIIVFASGYNVGRSDGRGEERQRVIDNLKRITKIRPGTAVDVFDNVQIRVSEQTLRMEENERILRWMEENVYNRSMDDWDRKLRPNHAMWVFFSPTGPNANVRELLLRAMTLSQREDMEREEPK